MLYMLIWEVIQKSETTVILMHAIFLGRFRTRPFQPDPKYDKAFSVHM